jgi:predicted ester cyclase
MAAVSPTPVRAGVEADPQGLFWRLHDAMNSCDPAMVAAAIDELVAADAQIHAPVASDAAGPDLLKAIWSGLLHAYPDLRVTVQELIAAGDTIVVWQTVTGTHRGEHLGLAPTGRVVSYDEIFILRFAGDRLVEVRGVVDTLAQLRQLGAIPRWEAAPGGPVPDR